MFSEAVGAVAPRPAAEPVGHRAPESAADLAGGAERDRAAAQVNERVDRVTAQAGSVAWQQPVATELKGLYPSFLAGKATKTWE